MELLCDRAAVMSSLRFSCASAYKQSGTVRIRATTRLDGPDEEWRPRFASRCRLSSRKLFRRMLRRSQIDELRSAVGADGLITGNSQLQTYECDGLTNFRVMPDAVVLPRTAGADAGRGPAMCSGQNSVCESRCGNGSERRRAACGGRYRHQPGAHEPHSRGRHCQSAGRGRARSDQCACDPTGGARRDTSMRPIRLRNRCAPSAATWRRIPAARIA